MAGDRPTRILYLTNERQARLMDFYAPLVRSLGALCEVEVVRRRLDVTEGQWCRNTTILGHRATPLVSVEYANTFDWVLTDAMYSYLTEDWQSITARRGILFADQHGPMVAHYVGLAHALGFELFLPLYLEPTRRFHPYLDPQRVYWLSYWIDPAVFRDWEQPKATGVLQTGAVHPSVYPIRTAVLDAMRGQPYYTRIPLPRESTVGPGWPSGEAYAKLLNTARMSICCTSCYHYSLTKLFEIPAARTALVSDYTDEMGKLGFIPSVNFLPVKLGEDIRGKIEWWLDHPAFVQEVTDAGHALIHQRHTADIKAAELLQVLTRISDRDDPRRSPEAQ